MLSVYTFYTDETRIDSLKQSASMNHLQIHYLKKDTWNGYEDKILAMKAILSNHSDMDIICFIDAYDVIVNQDEKYIWQTFLDYDCDLLLGAELNCYPETYKNQYSSNPSHSHYKYVNSGGYMGYKWAIQKLLDWKSVPEMVNICCYGGDQSYFMEYYLGGDHENIQLDSHCRIFQNMVLVSWNEFEFTKGKVFNTVMNTFPSFIHFNGGTWQQQNRQNIMPVWIDKLQCTLTNNTTDNLHSYSQIITPSCFPHSQI